MYLDYILFIAGGVCALIAVLLGVYLIVSYRRGKIYKSILDEETAYSEFVTTAMLTSAAKSRLADEAKTQLVTVAQTPADDGRTEFQNDASQKAGCVDFNAAALEGRYILKSEIHGGGMSRVFLAENVKLGNPWIIKFIPKHLGELANEENILKLLNHISLPRIVDIFHDETGLFLVESFIEGVSLDKLLETGQKFGQLTILDWAEQLARVLGYLHRMEPHPIYHFDLKPSNIMVTHDNRLVLIDFGISKRYGADDNATVGITYQYAAPEQLNHSIPDKYKALLFDRFGELPVVKMYWKPDARTDIFGLGTILFRIAAGQLPTIGNTEMLKDIVSHEIYEVIAKCLCIDPNERYKNIDEFLAAIQKIKGSKLNMARTLFMRKLASVSAAGMVVLSGGSMMGGFYIGGQENASILDIRPETITVSLQQSSDLTIVKQMPNGNQDILDNERLQWSYSSDNIARVDGSRISGINIGETFLSGRYRNKEITLNVRVVEPMDGMVDISQRYQLGHTVEVFAGTAEREHIDGIISEAEFVSPESIAVADDGKVYLADSGLLRIIRDGRVESVDFEPSFLTPHIVRCYQTDVYILTDPWEDDDGIYYGIIKLTNEGAEGLYMADAKFTAVEDFVFSPDGLMCFIDRNEGVGATYLKTLNPSDTDDIVTLCELPKGTSALTVDERGAVYLANPETGAIQVWQDGALSFFAGIENEKAFIDGAAPLFYMPQKIKYSNGFLFVWDFNVLRRISVRDGAAGECITLAGEASPTFDLDITKTKQSAEDIILPNGKLMDFAVKDNGILLTDPKHGVMWWVE